MPTKNQPASELHVSWTVRLPKVLQGTDLSQITGSISEEIRDLIVQRLASHGFEANWDSTHFLHLGTPVVADSCRCSRCETWTVATDGIRATSVISQRHHTDQGDPLCEQCWALYTDEPLAELDTQTP